MLATKYDGTLIRCKNMKRARPMSRVEGLDKKLKRGYCNDMEKERSIDIGFLKIKNEVTVNEVGFSFDKNKILGTGLYQKIEEKTVEMNCVKEKQIMKFYYELRQKNIGEKGF